MSKRTHEEPAFVLHRHDWSETSLILDVFTRHHGRMALVAKGVKRPTSQFRPVLLPLQPLLLGWGGEAEVRTLKSAQWAGGHVMPTGDALLSGSYLNELLLRLLARDDPHPRLFDHYALAVRLLSEQPQAQALVLRAFELMLLRETGLLADLAHEGSSLAGIDARSRYVLTPEVGLRLSSDDDGQALEGAHWLSLARALEAPQPMVELLGVPACGLSALRLQLRALLHYHSGMSVFRTRQLMLDIQALARRPAPGRLQDGSHER
ncbi:MAG: DNA repair protein RecO [Burkholderiales bacterium]|nr:MAG: DNA repair protein RecO [Burkholderiales bacterium]